MLIITHIDAVCQVALNRPDCRNAFNAELIRALTETFETLSRDPQTRVVHLRGEGTVFSAGADLEWMRTMAKANKEENKRDAVRLGRLFEAINSCSKPVLCEVHGAVMGGGVGLVAASDIVVADKKTTFALSEVKLGLIPAVISPYVIRKMGESQARRYFLTGETFSAEAAQAMGLVHEVSGNTQATVAEFIERLLAAGPEALGGAKRLIETVSGRASQSVLDYTHSAIAAHRVSEEGQEGMAAFLEKRKARWVPA